MKADLLEEKKSIKAALIHPPDIYGGTSPESMQSTVIALRAMGKRLWDYKQKNTVKIVNLKIVNLKEGENSLLICCGVGGEGQWMMGRGSTKEAAF